MGNVKLVLRNEYTDKNGESSINAVLHIKGIKVRIPTGISAAPEKWDAIKQCIKGSSKFTKDHNLILGDCLSKINDILVKYRLQRKDLSAEQLRYEYDHYSASIDFIAFMKEEIQLRRGEIEKTTLRQHQVCLNKLTEFKKEISFSEIDETFVLRFKSYLKDKLKNDVNTISSNLKVFKAYINRARRKKIINHDPFTYIALVKKDNDRTFLTEEEIARLVKLYNRNWLAKTYQKVLRHFLFSVVTGIRISDVKSISMEQIIKDTLIFIPYKTRNQKANTCRIPLCSLAKKLIQDESPNRIAGPIFTMISEPRTNTLLREIAAHANIDKHITFHTGRHTFATYFLRKTKNLLALQKLLGHTDMRETLIYSHILTEDIEAEMMCFNQLMP